MESLNWRFYTNETQWTQLSEVPYTNIVCTHLGAYVVPVGIDPLWQRWCEVFMGHGDDTL